MARELRNNNLYLFDILDSIKKIYIYTQNMSFEDFSVDEKTIDAVIRNFEIIGEASNHLPKDLKLKYADIDWRALTDFRNVIIHEYFGISIEIIWDIIENELPNLEPNIKKILEKSNDNNISINT